MSREESNSAGADRDLLCRGPRGFLLWCAPWLVFVLGFSVSPRLRTALWTTSFALMGAACLLNAARCGRVPLPLHGAVFHPCRCYFLSLWPGTPAAWTIGMEVDWRRNSHRSFSPLLHPRTVSRPVSAPEKHRDLTNRMKVLNQGESV